MRPTPSPPQRSSSPIASHPDASPAAAGPAAAGPAAAGPADPWPAPRAAGPLDAVVELPGSKSVTNRALVLAALADGRSVVRRPLRSRDTELMAAALTGLGVDVTDTPQGDWVVDGVAGDYAALRFNTAVAKIHELVNHVTKAGTCPRPVAEALALLLAPLAPHLAEELWALLGHPPSVGRQPFPVADPALLVDDTVTLVVQVNGKVRDRFEVATTITAEEAEAVALASAKVVELLAGGTPRKVVARPPTLVNVVL